MYLDEDESLGREISEGWEWDRDDVLVFVSSAVQFSLQYSPSQAACVDQPFLDYSRHFPHGELQIVATRLEQCDRSIALTNNSATRQHLQCDTLPERRLSEQCAVETPCVRYQDQRDMAPQPGPESYPRSFRSLSIIGIHSIPWARGATQLPAHASRHRKVQTAHVVTPIHFPLHGRSHRLPLIDKQDCRLLRPRLHLGVLFRVSGIYGIVQSLSRQPATHFPTRIRLAYIPDHRSRRSRAPRGNRRIALPVSFVYMESSSLACTRAPFCSCHVEGCSRGPDPQEAEIARGWLAAEH
jgi:hypothetical protein